MPFRPLALRASLALSVLVSACSGGGGGPGGGGSDPKGSLAVAVSGLPGGAAADLTVGGPAGYSHHLTGSETLSGLAVGSYTVTSVDVSNAGFDYAAQVTGSPATVTDGGTATVTAAYAATTGKLTVTVSGLPGGATGDVDVSGPAAFSQHLGATTTLTGLAPGSYTVTAAVVPSAGQSYAATIAGSPATVSAGATASATAAYALVPANGQLTVTVTGGISAAENRAHVSIGGPNGYSATLSTSPQTFTNLVPGTYTVSATGFTSASGSFGVTFTPQVTGSPATVTGGGNPQVAVVFLPPVPAVTAVTPKKGDLTVAGTSVAVTGTDFVPGATVTFGGVPGTVQLMNGKTSLLATAPAVPPGAVDVRVTTPGGTSPAVAADQIASYHFTAYAVPTGGGQGGMTLGPDGNLWFTERARGKVGRVTPAGVVTEFQVPVGKDKFGNDVIGDPVDITVGADGNLWFSDYNNARVGRVTPDGTVTMIPLASGCISFGITHGPGTSVWFTENFCPASGQNHVGSVDTANTATQQSFPMNPFPNVFGITLGADGNLWFAEYNHRKIGRITPAGVYTEQPPATPPPDTALTSSNPLWLVAGADGNVWFNESKLGTITPGGVLTERTVPGGAGGVVVGRINRDTKGRVWYSTGNSIGWTDTATFANEDYPVNAFGIPSGIAVTDDGVAWVLTQGGSSASVVKLEY